MAVSGSPYAHIATATTTLVKSGPGVLRGIQINGTAAGTVTLYDSLTGSGTVIAVLPASAVVGERNYFNLQFTVGLTIVTAAAYDLTIIYG